MAVSRRWRGSAVADWVCGLYNTQLFHGELFSSERTKHMAHAVVRTGGKQFLIEEGQTIRVAFGQG